ncbi:MAG: hypothetical protein ACREQL_04360, partial [Candidatus Binatia bacterium]
DHAMLTGMLAVRNLLDGERNDLWGVNTEREYHEEVRAAAPGATDTTSRVLAPGFAKLDRLALGAATGSVAGMAIFLATLALVAKGGALVGPHLALLGQFLPGYGVSLAGSFTGLGYGLAGGFVAGWTFAVLRNATALFVLAVVRRRVEWRALGRLLDYV